MSAIAEAVDYLLAAVGDVSVEGEANRLRQNVAVESGLSLTIARISDERGTPAERLAAAQAQLAAAQAELDAAASAANATPAGALPVPTSAAADVGGVSELEAAEQAAAVAQQRLDALRAAAPQ